LKTRSSKDKRSRRSWRHQKFSKNIRSWKIEASQELF